MTWVLGIDLGTSACKVTLLNPDGRSRSASADGYAVSAPHPGWAEQDPASWWTAVVGAVKTVLAMPDIEGHKVAGLSLTGQMHSLVLLGSEAQVLRPAILWSDQRSAAECAEAIRVLPELPGITQNPLIPAFTLAQLLWVRRHEPAVYQDIAHVLLPKDWLRLRLTGQFATDESDASGTAMFDVNHRAWSEVILRGLGIDRGWLPRAGGSIEATGTLGDLAAEDLGLPPGIPVFGGAADQVAQAVATGITEPGTVGISIGTSGVVVTAVTSPTHGSFCHALPDRWLRLNSMHAAGASLSWFRDCFEPGRSIEDLLAEAATVDSARRAPVFLPFLGGLRDDAGLAMPAAFIDVSASHRREDFVRAILEGVACELRRMIDAWGDDRASMTYRISGGGSRSRLWQQVIADALGAAVTTTTQSPADGAAMLAAVGLGWWPSLPAAAAATQRSTSTTEPTADGVARMSAVNHTYLARMSQLRASEPAPSPRRVPEGTVAR